MEIFIRVKLYLDGVFSFLSELRWGARFKAFRRTLDYLTRCLFLLGLSIYCYRIENYELLMMFAFAFILSFVLRPIRKALGIDKPKDICEQCGEKADINYGSASRVLCKTCMYKGD